MYQLYLSNISRIQYDADDSSDDVNNTVNYDDLSDNEYIL